MTPTAAEDGGGKGPDFGSVSSLSGGGSSKLFVGGKKEQALAIKKCLKAGVSANFGKGPIKADRIVLR